MTPNLRRLKVHLRNQGSSRTWTGRAGPEDDVEDGEVVWTLEENKLQKSGLPREFTFIILLKKGEPETDTVFDIQVDPVISNWVGNYPMWYVNLLPYQPLRKPPIDLETEIGQTFQPCLPGRGYNFANLASSFEDFVALPGTTYSSSVSGTFDQTRADLTRNRIIPLRCLRMIVPKRRQLVLCKTA